MVSLVGFWRNTFGLGGVVAEVLDAPTFTADPAEILGANIDPAVFGLSSFTTTIGPAPRIDRKSAIQCPAVKRSRDMIAGTLGGLPLGLLDPAQNPVASSLFEQPERGTVRSVSMARLFEDLLFEGVAWWRVTEFAWDGWPRWVKRLKPGTVSEDGQGRDGMMVDGRFVPSAALIRFDSPTDGLLIAGARAIRTCLLLDAYAANAAQGIPPLDYFQPADDADPLGSDDDDEDAEVQKILDGWQAARRARTTAYVPASLKYQMAGFDPKALQMAEQRDHAVLEIARLAGIDPEDLGVSVTSRTYANQFDRRKALIDFTLGQYLHAVEERLSVGDINPRGYAARFDLDTFLRSDPAARWASYRVGLDVGALAQDEIRPMEGKPQIPAPEAVASPAPPELTVVPALKEATP